MTVDQAAEYCGTEARAIWQDLEDGSLKAHQTEDGIRIPRSEVEETCEPTGDNSPD
jgi:excisionase family DNA binding protein